jgi:flagellar motor protein MotB
LKGDVFLLEQSNLIMQGGALAVVLMLFVFVVKWLTSSVDEMRKANHEETVKFTQLVENHLIHSIEAQKELKEAIYCLKDQILRGYLRG